MRPPLEGLRAAPGWKRALRQPRTRLGAAILLVLVLTIFLSPLLVPYGYSQIITVDGQRDRGAKNLAPFEYSQMGAGSHRPRRDHLPRTSSARTSCAATTSCG